MSVRSTKGDTPTILIPARLHPHAVERVGALFQRVMIARADADLLDPAMIENVRGIASMTTIDARFIDALPKLEIIANFGVGYDAVDAAYAASRGIVVTHTPDVLDDEVADTTIALLLNTLRELENWKVSVIAMNGMAFDLSSPHGRMLATFLSGIAEFERDLISERVKSGLAAAKARGKKLGRQAGERPKSDRLASKVMTLNAEGRSYRWIARDLGISKNTVADIVKRNRFSLAPKIETSP